MANDKDLMSAQEALAGGDFERAYKGFNKLIKGGSKSAEVYFGKAEAAMGVPKASVEEIQECYKTAVELDSKNPIFQSSYAAYLVEIGRFNEAEAAYNKAAELDPENARYYYSEFGMEYAMRAPVVMEKFLDDKTSDMIKIKGLKYLLKAVGMTEDDAKRLLQ